ncbi:protein STRUBBELIG-RECEPTOR FAMILY 5-like [Nymphaea colorata]|nr:protein STRUBBELIG-RECEPTOR FAMILY 5-like [Nymphaea colorata]
MADEVGGLVWSVMVGDCKYWVYVMGTIFLLLDPVIGTTDAKDVFALKAMYTSLNSAPQLTGWSASGGDPCDHSWKGIKCSGSSVTQIQLSGLELTGSMGNQLSSLISVIYFDLSNNKLQGDIPYQLPPNSQHINLSRNSFSGAVPYSISQMVDLKYLDLAHNHLNGQLSDMFGQLQKLKTLDLSFNGLSGGLPHSFGSLSMLDTLYLQSNQITGPVDVLTSLPLDHLNLENNHFSGWVPDELKKIKDVKISGNSWSSTPAPPPPHASQSAPPSKPIRRHNTSASSRGYRKSGTEKKNMLVMVVTITVVIGVALTIGILAALFSRGSSHRHRLDEGTMNTRQFTPLASQEINEFKTMESSSSIHVKTLHVSPSLGLKPPPSDRYKSFNESDFLNKINSRITRAPGPVNATKYSLAELQMASGNFGRDHLVGEGTLGRVFKAKYVDGKVFAVKVLDLPVLRGDNSEVFMEAVSEISRLHHQNITEFLGYCSERDQNLLVYEYLRNGSLHQFLHLSDDYGKPLTWNTRIKIALGTARALEYLHEVCSPSVIHKNIKSANILLDNELNPHISDCGLSAFYEDLSHNLGVGYMAPECTTAAGYTLKSDVYSFGVVMLELLTGRKSFDSSKSRSEQSLVRWATPQLHDIDALTKMVDPALRGLYPAKSLSRFADVIALCVQSEPEFRPPMSEVVQNLVRLVQRSSMKRTPADELDASRKTSDADQSEYPYQ